jgi:hypothetical protein
MGPGRTGSSILSGIIAQAGYFINADKLQKRMFYPGGDYENPDLVELNKSLLLKSGYGADKIVSFHEVDIAFMSNFAKSGETSEFEEFIEVCSDNSPWLWKDPRLTFTIYFWRNFITLNKIKFLFITRDRYQVFRSHSKYGIYYTKQEVYQRYAYQEQTANEFFSSHGLEPLRLTYAEIWQKDHLLTKLNNFLGTELTHVQYDNIVRPNLKKKESETTFWTRYYWGVLKLMAKKVLGKN